MIAYCRLKVTLYSCVLVSFSYITVENSAVLLQPLDKCRLLSAVSGDSIDNLITTRDHHLSVTTDRL